MPNFEVKQSCLEHKAMKYLLPKPSTILPDIGTTQLAHTCTHTHMHATHTHTHTHTHTRMMFACPYALRENVQCHVDAAQFSYLGILFSSSLSSRELGAPLTPVHINIADTGHTYGHLLRFNTVESQPHFVVNS